MAPQVQKEASALIFLRSLNFEKVKEAAQWSSCRSFVKRYMTLPLQDGPMFGNDSAT